MCYQKLQKKPDGKTIALKKYIFNYIKLHSQGFCQYDIRFGMMSYMYEGKGDAGGG